MFFSVMLMNPTFSRMLSLSRIQMLKMCSIQFVFKDQNS